MRVYDFRIIETENDVLRVRLGDMKKNVKIALWYLQKPDRGEAEIEKAIAALKEIK